MRTFISRKKQQPSKRFIHSDFSFLELFYVLLLFAKKTNLLPISMDTLISRRKILRNVKRSIRVSLVKAKSMFLSQYSE